MLEATMYTRIYEQPQLGKCWHAAESQPSEKILLQNNIHVIYACFSVYKNIFTMKLKKNYIVLILQFDVHKLLFHAHF